MTIDVHTCSINYIPIDQKIKKRKGKQINYFLISIIPYRMLNTTSRLCRTMLWQVDYCSSYNKQMENVIIFKTLCKDCLSAHIQYINGQLSIQCGTSYISKSLKHCNLQTLILEALKLSIHFSVTSC